ncbi:hypothetical protein [Bdellovibrio sp.]|uniref:hypothetical protein n=1 Tax=Bdellovibrio TaxID=958 RepID=UPI0032216FB4
MKKLLASMIAISTALFMVACGKSGGDSNNNTPTCANGTIWNGSACILPNGGTGGGNIVTTTVGFADGSTRYTIANRDFAGSLRITNRSGYKEFLREALAICDRNSHIWGRDYGLANCDTWTSGTLFLSFTIGPNMIPAVVLRAYPPAASYFSYGFSFGIDAAGMAHNPLYLNNQNTFSLIPDKEGNHSQAFEIRANGAADNLSGRYLIQIQAHKGTLANSEIQYDLAYKNGKQNAVFATGTLKRFQ